MLHDLTKWSNDHWLIVVVTIVIGVVFYELGQFLIIRLTKRISRLSAKHNPNVHAKDAEKRARTVAGLFINIWRTLVIAIVALILFSLVFPNVSLAPLFASAGIVGVALGFGAQSLVKDFLSGIFIISENQYRVGDVIEVDGFSGTVEKIGTRCTVFRDIDGFVHYFPNGIIQHVTNKTMGYGMARLSIGVSPVADLDKVIELINSTAATMAEEEKWRHKILETPKFTVVSEFTATNVSLSISGKTPPSDQWSVASELRRRLFNVFEQEKIPLGTTIPVYNQAAKK